MSNSVHEAIHSTGTAGILTIIGNNLVQFLSDSIWLLLVPIVLVLADTWWGVNESRKNGEEIRFSRAGWKTLRKVMDYYTLLCVAIVICHTLPEDFPISNQWVMFYFLLIPSLFDLSSIIGHILVIHDIKFNLRKFIINLIKFKQPEVGNALDNSLEDK